MLRIFANDGLPSEAAPWAANAPVEWTGSVHLASDRDEDRAIACRSSFAMLRIASEDILPRMPG